MNFIYKELAMIEYFNKFIDHASQKLFEEVLTYGDERIDKYYKESVARGIKKSFRKNILFLLGTYHNDSKYFLLPGKSSILKHKKELFDHTFYVMLDKTKIKHNNCAQICIYVCDIYRNKLNKFCGYFDGDNNDVNIRKELYKNQVSLYYKSGNKEKYFTLSKSSYDKLERLYIGDKQNVNLEILGLLIRYTCFDTDKEGYFFSADHIYKFIIDNNYENNTLEAFSGSINSNLKNYCSLFSDIESQFKSKGSFFVLDKLDNYSILICNPPFIKILIDQLFVKILGILDSMDNKDIILIIPDHRSQQQADNDMKFEVPVGVPIETTRLTNKMRYEGYSLYYDKITSSEYIKKIFVMHNFKYHDYFKDRYHNIRTDTLVIYLSNNKSIDIYDKFEKHIKID